MSLAGELLVGWAPVIGELVLKSSSGGRFEVSVDGEVVFSKATLKRHVQPGEIAGMMEKRLGPKLAWRE